MKSLFSKVAQSLTLLEYPEEARMRAFNQGAYHYKPLSGGAARAHSYRSDQALLKYKRKQDAVGCKITFLMVTVISLAGSIQQKNPNIFFYGTIISGFFLTAALQNDMKSAAIPTQHDTPKNPEA